VKETRIEEKLESRVYINGLRARRELYSEWIKRSD